jgi:hypothetical protein
MLENPNGPEGAEFAVLEGHCRGRSSYKWLKRAAFGAMSIPV